MRKTVFFIFFILICFFAYTQTITNRGENIIVKSGTTFKFTNLHNSLVGGYFYYDTNLDVSGNWTNISPAIFDQGVNGSVTLNGSTQQTITSGGSSFRDLTIINTAANDNEIVLGDNMLIESSLNLSDGIINTNSNKLVFQSSATSNSGNTTSFVHGEMEKAGATQFIFPCGDVNSRDLDGDAIDENYVVWSPMKSNPSASTTVNVEYFFDNIGMPDWWEYGGNMAPTLHHVSDREYYLVSATQDFTDVTLYWNDNHHDINDICVHSFCNGTPSNFVPADLSVVYWNGVMWVDIDYNSGTSNLLHDQGFITSRFEVPFGAKSQTFITYGSKNNQNPLPVELLNFYPDCKDSFVILYWNTVTEANNRGFFIEKSKDANNFEPIAFVEGMGNSISISEYSFVDTTVSKNGTYYRLKQVDNDGNFSISNSIYADCYDGSSEPLISIYPNPFKQDISIIGNNLPSENTFLYIYDILGAQIYQSKPKLLNGIFSLNIDLEKLPPAMYIVKIVSGDYISVKKIEKY